MKVENLKDKRKCEENEQMRKALKNRSTFVTIQILILIPHKIRPTFTILHSILLTWQKI